MARLIGTAGHVDHGKTTLLKALTGIDTDRLPEEKKRGMTIDLGFAYIDLPPHGRVSIVDVPGHERFLTNMIAGAQGIDVALLCVGADESVMPQTREHLQIIDLLPVQSLVVAMTRADLADETMKELVREEVRELLTESRFGDAPVVAVSAVTGEGLDELKARLAEAIASAEFRSDGALDEGGWFLPIDRVFAVKGHGVVVTGTLARGKVTVGEPCVIEPGRREARVRAIHVHGEAVAESERGRRTALNLSGVKLQDVRRGQCVGAPDACFETSTLIASMRWLEVPRRGSRARVSIGTEEAICRVFPLPDEPGRAQLRLESAIACARGQPLIVRKYSPPELLGGGVVLVPRADKKTRSVAANLAEGKSLRQIVETILDARPAALETEEIARLSGVGPAVVQTVLRELESSRSASELAGSWFRPETLREVESRFAQALRAVHGRDPSQGWVQRESVFLEAGLNWNQRLRERFVASLAAKGAIESKGSLIRDPGFRSQLNPRQRELLERVCAALEASGINVPSAEDLAHRLGVPRQAVEDVLRLGIAEGRVVRVADGVHYTRDQMESVKSRMRELFGSQPFPASSFRDAFGTSRKYAIPLLEHLDATRFTLRVGDQRVIREP